jgi:RNA polymerase sigma factor (sigma-70 family)
MNTKNSEVMSRQQRFESLLNEHIGIVFRVIRTYTRTQEDQQDLAQEIKLQVWSSFGSYNESVRFSTWMYRVALNTAISWTRKTSLRTRYSAPLEENLAAPSHPTEETQVLYQLINQLDPLNRALLMLYLDDQSYAEIGDVLGITPANVATKISRIKQQLRNLANPKEPWNSTN